MRHWLLLVTLTFLTACSASMPNKSFYPFSFSAQNTLAANAKVIIASHNLGVPTRKYLERFEPRVDNVVKAYLKEHGYQLVSTKIYDAAYQSAIQQFGNPFNPSTGAINNQRQLQVLSATLEQLQTNQTADAIIYTDIIERQVAVNRGSDKPYSMFDGVRRKVKVQGTGSGVTNDFDWNKPIDASSLLVSIYTIEGERILQAAGGLDLTEAVDTRRGRFARSRVILKKDDFIYEAVALALHPFIASDLYIMPNN